MFIHGTSVEADHVQFACVVMTDATVPLAMHAFSVTGATEY
jgi:hypothetical protein